MSRRRRRATDPPDPDDPRRQAEPPTADGLLAAFAAKRGWDRRLRGARVHEVWDEIAGAALAPHVEPVRLHGGVLVVRVVSPAWATQVRYLAPELVARANEVLGDGQVTQLVVVAGSGR